MSRLRQALPCRAQRSHGRGPCGNYAITGGTVCRVHGGAAPQVRAAADRRAQQARIEVMSSRVIEHYRAIHARRIEVTMRVLGCSWETAAGPYAGIFARWRLEDDPRAGGLSADERNLFDPRPEEA